MIGRLGSVALFICVSAVSTHVNASERTQHPPLTSLGIRAHCAIVYDASPATAPLLQQQHQRLVLNLRTKGIALFSLYRWPTADARTSLSGRQRNVIRERYQLPRGQDQAVVIGRDGVVRYRQVPPIDLTQLAQRCRG